MSGHREIYIHSSCLNKAVIKVALVNLFYYFQRQEKNERD